jgi:methionyl-tRNA synthetase
VETLDDGSGEERVILSGLVPYMAPEDLLGKSIILADNLAPRKMRGIMSHGMLLAADYKDENGKECIEVLDAAWAPPGTPVILEGGPRDNSAKPAEISVDTFFSVKIEVKDHAMLVGGKPLLAAGRPITTVHTVNGEAH